MKQIIDGLIKELEKQGYHPSAYFELFCKINLPYTCVRCNQSGKSWLVNREYLPLGVCPHTLWPENIGQWCQIPINVQAMVKITGDDQALLYSGDTAPWVNKLVFDRYLQMLIKIRDAL